MTGTKFHSTASASTNLTVIPSDSQIALETGNGNGSISAWIWREQYAPSNWGIFHDNDTNDVIFVGNNTERVRIGLGATSLKVGGNEVITSGNISSQSVSYASSSGSAGYTYNLQMPRAGGIDFNHYDAILRGYLLNEGNGYGGSQGWILDFPWDWDGHYTTQIGIGLRGEYLAYRGDTGNGTYTSWKRVIDSGNISSQSVNYANSTGSATYASKCTTNIITEDTLKTALHSGFYRVDGKVTIHAGWQDNKNTAGLDLQIDDSTTSSLRYRARVGGGGIGSWKTLMNRDDTISWSNVTGKDSPTFSTVYSNDWFRSNGNSGWYSQTYGGGWWMTDNSWIRSYGGHGVVAGGFYHSSYGSNDYLLTSNAGARHINEFYRYGGWWNSGSGQNVNDATDIVFAYTDHGAPSGWGTLCTFSYTKGGSYNLQIHGAGCQNQLWFRNRSSDCGQLSWKRCLTSDEIVDNAYRLYPYSTGPDGSHPGYGLRCFYSWGNYHDNSSGYCNGISIGSHVNDTCYGFQIVQDLWNDTVFVRRYNCGWLSWMSLIDSSANNQTKSGNLTCANFYANSDRHIKSHIRTIDRQSLERLFSVSDKLLKKYTLKQTGKESYGFVAQELEKYIPEAVTKNNDGIKSVSYNIAYTKLFASLVNEIKNLKAQVKTLMDDK